MPTGLHAHPHRDPLFPEITVELLRLLWVFESSFLQLSSFCIHIRNLLEARVIITAYNQHVRLLSPGLGWLAPPKSTRGWEPTLLWNHYTQYQKAPTFTVRCESSKHHTDRKGAPFMNQEKYIGMDVHDASISVAVKNAQGKLLMECVLETKAATILEFMQGLRGTLAVTFEEGTMAAWLHDPLKPHVS